MTKIRKQAAKKILGTRKEAASKFCLLDSRSGDAVARAGGHGVIWRPPLQGYRMLGGRCICNSTGGQNDISLSIFDGDKV